VVKKVSLESNGTGCSGHPWNKGKINIQGLQEYAVRLRLRQFLKSSGSDGPMGKFRSR